MSILEDSRRSAMNIEQAALMPARLRRGWIGSAALQTMMSRARNMDSLVLSNSVSTAEDATAPIPPAIALTATSDRFRRAALHHVLCK